MPLSGRTKKEKKTSKVSDGTVDWSKYWKKRYWDNPELYRKRYREYYWDNLEQCRARNVKERRKRLSKDLMRKERYGENPTETE